MFHHSGANCLDIAASAGSDAFFDRFLAEFFGALRKIIQETADLNPKAKIPEGTTATLKALLELDNHLYQGISLKALEYGKGLHPKHRMTKYHDFFCKNVSPEESVLDIGCGNGYLTSDIAKCTRGRVVGIDMNKDNVEFARNHYQTDNIEFIYGDVRTDIRESRFDVVVMSNVLEHLSERVEFLKRILKKVGPKKFLVRVPMYEREWMVPLKEELGIDYMLDAGHEIEYTLEGFFGELRAAELKPESWEIRWGEIWCSAVPEASGKAHAGGDN